MTRLIVTSSLRDAQEFRFRMNGDRLITSSGSFESSDRWVSEWFDDTDEDDDENFWRLKETIEDQLAGIECEVMINND